MKLYRITLYSLGRISFLNVIQLIERAITFGAEREDATNTLQENSKEVTRWAEQSSGAISLDFGWLTFLVGRGLTIALLFPSLLP